MSTTKPGIYKITNLINGKIYIGSAFSLSNRFSVHKYTLKNNRHKNKHLQNAWNLYGEENFLFEVLEIVEDKNLIIEREQYYIDFYKPHSKLKGYNIAKKAGNTAGVRASEETRKKQSESARRRPKYKWTEEQKKNRAEKRKGQKMPWAKTDWATINEIRKEYTSGVAQKEIGAKYNLAQTTVSEIIRNVIWKDETYVYKRKRNG